MKQLKLQSVMLFWEVMYLSATAVTLLLAGKSESSEVCFRFVVSLFVFSSWVEMRGPWWLGFLLEQHRQEEGKILIPVFWPAKINNKLNQ